jgi:uncharacterized phage protein (TIGR02218 family)
MRNVLTSLQARLEQSPLKLARLFRMTLLSGQIFRFTDHDLNIILPSDDSNVYQASSAIQVAAIESTNGTVAVNTELTINYVNGFDRDAAVSGLYDNALFEVMLVSYDNPGDGTFLLMEGNLEQKSSNNRNVGSFNLKGIVNRIDGVLGEYYTADCRANLGDHRCNISLSTFTHAFTVDSVSSARTVFVADVAGVTSPSGTFTLGNLKFDGDTYAIEIVGDTYLGGNLREFTLAIPRFTDITLSDFGDAIRGCNKQLSTCLNTFNNIVNYRGEPFVPSQDATSQSSG